jgi:predicted membrane channel-forming protein YqfA (hemolysin III family)
LGFFVVLVCMAVSMVPPGESSNKVLFEAKLFIGTVAAILLGLVLYWRGVRVKRLESSQETPGGR